MTHGLVTSLERTFGVKRTWQPREMQMVTEYLTREYPRTFWATRVRLGSPHPELLMPVLSEEERRMIGVWRRWADAVIVQKDKVIILEAAIRPDPGDVSKLELYSRLLPVTPEYRQYKDRPIEMILLYAIEDPATILLARERGIRCIEYKPDWLSSYVALLTKRESRGVLHVG